ncbi:MAG: inositol monophosphatase [Gammaproteobacteria bacterium]|nr:inositol monophosphatase [Gammaproteobacteria bacterium]
MQPMVNIAVRAARQAGNVIVRALDQIDTLNIREKATNDFVTDIDLRAEQEIIKVIKKAYPHHSILAEESGTNQGSEFEWIIDPLDGTTNFLHNFPQFAVSIAVRYRGRLEHAVVYDPLRQEIFSASVGEGARLNDRRIRVTSRPNMKGALLGTGIPFREDQDLELYLKTLRALLPDSAGVRRPGSAALDLAYVAAGRIDGFWEMGLQIWDMAAGILLIQEAGGIVTDLKGGSDYFETGNIIAGGMKVQAEMTKRIKSSL